ncbi:MAG: hypothetical protein KAI33_08260, partial [Elusimicrobiales bacterium]|nr:hypothetical protein [Elusimicrobiales bacterium]
LVPKLSDVYPYLAKAAAFCQKQRTNVIIDDIPLCFMNGFEEFAIYTWTLTRGDDSYLPHAKHHASCKTCRLSSICPGLDNAYFKIHGDKELKASKKSGKETLKEIEHRRSLRRNGKPSRSLSKVGA